ncbi:hypothetical protein BDW02DRAFT_613776 [Decorospora gaudefroyi]|uniref:Uncharacterized protein n=1 Tax=Decorospora gaudefroyi TaxID=184978 RepID=A0A6A5K3Q9_9PLEO|nr:hypothetical protein BDW02DRAFT_613776 [Decorospora gaudefroyi]
MEGFNEACVSQQLKEEFEEWIARPPGRVRYLICKPLSEHSINTLLDAGTQCNRRPEIPGVNRPYWYRSTGSSFTEAAPRNSSAASETNKRKQQDLANVRKRGKRHATLARRPANSRIFQTSRPLCTPILVSAPVPIQERLLDAVLRPTALRSCVTLIQAWRSQLARIELTPAASDRIARLAALDMRIRLAHHRGWLDALHLKSAQYAFAFDMDSRRQGALCFDGSVYDKVLKAQGFVSATKNSRD